MSIRTVLLFFFFSSMLPAAMSFEVIHKRALWPDGKGELRITDEAIEFQAAEEKHSRRWSYQDIQHFDRISEKEFILLSYEDIGWQFGRDRQYRFLITEGKLSHSLFQTISRRIGRPVTDRVVGTIRTPAYELPVKHLHSFGGCEGKLLFTESAISYATDHATDARRWRLSRDVDSVWSMHPYHLELHVYDNNRREFSRTRVYKFDLKEALDEEFYRELKFKLYGLAEERPR